MAKPKTVDEYIAGVPEPARWRLEQIRELIKQLAPDAQEKISYGIPYYSLNGRLIYFAYFKNHTNLTIMASGIEHFAKDLRGYTFGKGSIQFPHDKPLPLDFIKRIIKFRVAEQRTKNYRPRYKS